MQGRAFRRKAGTQGGGSRKKRASTKVVTQAQLRRVIGSMSEVKHTDYFQDWLNIELPLVGNSQRDAGVTYNPYIVGLAEQQPINRIAGGSRAGQRVGNFVIMKKLHIRFQASVSPSLGLVSAGSFYPNVQMRMIVVNDVSGAGNGESPQEMPNYQDYLDVGTSATSSQHIIGAFRKWEVTNKYRILLDKTKTLVSDHEQTSLTDVWKGWGPLHGIKKTINLNDLRGEYNGTDGDATSGNALWMFLFFQRVGENGTTTIMPLEGVNIRLHSRLTYTDQ